jgi:Holliday junction resolvasome RuvABC endonuclease subunit
MNGSIDIPMKWDLKEVEKKLGKKLKREMYAFGIDIASKLTGWCLLKTTKTELTVLKMALIDTSKINVITDRLDKIADEVAKIQLPKDSNLVGVIEEPFVGANRNTAIILGLSCGVAYIMLKKRLPYRILLRAMAARKRIGMIRGNVKKEVAHKYLIDTLGFTAQEDITDGFILALAGLIPCEMVDTDD